MDNILQHWNVSGEPVTLIYKSAHNSTWNIGDKYILKNNPNAEQLSRNIHLANLLAAQNIPAVTYIKTINGEWTAPDKTYCLMEKIKGEHIDFYASPEIIRELGRGLARLHTALSEIEPELQCHDNNFLVEWRDYIKPGLVGVSDSLAEQTENRLFSLYGKLPRGPIHRDVHSQNVLFCDGKITGWLDFDLNRKDVRVFDLAYLLAGLLVGRIDDSQKIKEWKNIYRELLTGYDEVNTLTADERKALPILMIAIELLFVTYFGSMGKDEERDKANALAEWLHKNCRGDY